MTDTPHWFGRMAFEQDPLAAHRRRMSEPAAEFAQVRDALRTAHANAGSAAVRPLTGRDDTESAVFVVLARLSGAALVSSQRFENVIESVRKCGELVDRVDGDIERAAPDCRSMF